MEPPSSCGARVAVSLQGSLGDESSGSLVAPGGDDDQGKKYEGQESEENWSSTRRGEERG